MTERDVVSPDSPSVEVLSPDLQSVELTSPQSVSSIEIISPESEHAPELASPGSGSSSAVEVISPEPEPVIESLESSVCSDVTLTTEQQRGDTEAQLEAAMVESEKKSSESGESSEIVRVEMTSDKTSSDIEVIRRNSGKSLSGHWLLSASLSKHLLTLQHTSLRVFHVIHAFYCSTFYTFVTFSETANVST